MKKIILGLIAVCVLAATWLYAAPPAAPRFQPREILCPATGTLSAAQATGTRINNYGQAAANTQTLPPAAADYTILFQMGTTGAGAFNVKAGTGNKIYLDGVALDDGDKVTNAAPAVGDTFACWTFRTGASAWDWICTSGNGTWIDGGA